MHCIDKTKDFLADVFIIINFQPHPLETLTCISDFNCCSPGWLALPLLLSVMRFVILFIGPMTHVYLGSDLWSNLQPMQVATTGGHICNPMPILKSER